MKKNSVFKTINFINSILLIIVVVCTIFNLVIFTQKLYFLKTGKSKIREMSKEIQKLEDKLINLNSYSNLEEFVKKEGLVEAKNVKYIQILEGTVLAK